ncbi:MAG: V-type ATP synthase subunit E family protein [Candidatus Aminicenantaceae bacterium]
MSLEGILEKINKDAQAEADKIIKESNKKAREIIDSARKEASALAAALIEEAERKAQLESSRIITQARMEKRIKILSRKKEIINEILEKALAKADFKEEELKKKIVFKEGEREESYSREKLIEELRPRVENYILEVLKI